MSQDTKENIYVFKCSKCGGEYVSDKEKESCFACRRFDQRNAVTDREVWNILNK